jgi:NTP pyrophosphatase (non-canonical NTP hydrolase)
VGESIMTIREFQQWNRDTDRATNWDLQTTLQLVSHLTEEIGELVQAINRIHDYRGEIQAENENKLKREVVDVFWFLVKIANRFDVDLETEVENRVKRAEKWPADEYHDHLKNGLGYLDTELKKAKEKWNWAN